MSDNPFIQGTMLYDAYEAYMTGNLQKWFSALSPEQKEQYAEEVDKLSDELLRVIRALVVFTDVLEEK